jgi:CubicO group peptidase (beta-lactamase class C family)
MRKGVLILFLLAMAATNALAQNGQAPATSPTVDVRDAINSTFERFRQSAHVPGLFWGVVQNGRLTYAGALGTQDLATGTPVTADTVFRIASMSKAFTALAVLNLRDAGKLSLDDRLDRFVHEAAGWHYPTTDTPPLRVGDLLGHTAGFGPDDPWSDRQQPMSEQAFAALLAKGFSFNQVPETNYEYSSLGYALLGKVVSDVSGTRYDRYIEDTFMRPLGMAASGYEIADVPPKRLATGYRWENGTFVKEPSMGNGVFGAMGGVHTSANDYARWVGFLLSAWPARDGPEIGPVHRATVRELAIGTSFPRLSSRPRTGNAGPCSFASVYAAGFNVVRDCDLGLILTHNGGYPGYGSTVLLMPDSGTGIFAFDNRTYGVPIGAVFEAAEILKNQGLLKAAPLPISESLTHAYARVETMYGLSDVTPGMGDLAANFLMDRSAKNWRHEFGRLKQEVGSCAAQEPINPTGLRTGIFTWRCDHGSIQGTLELSPANPPLIQTLILKSAPSK